MKHLQLKYTFLHIFYWAAFCCVAGFIAIFLQYKGFNNSQVGIVAGGGALMSVFLSPIVSNNIAKMPGMTTNKLLTIIILFDIACFLMMAFLPLPIILIMVLYISMHSLYLATVPFLNQIATNYIVAGEDLNFGLSRGCGSVAYASTAVVMGIIISKLNPTVLSVIFALMTILTLVLLYSLPTIEIKVDTQPKEKSDTSAFDIVKDYPVFFFLLLGVCMCFAASSSLATYLINIVKSLGGNESLYGIAVFCMAASEMPAMAIAPAPCKRFNPVLLIGFCGFAYLIRNLTICFAVNLPMLMIGMAFQSLSYGLFTAVIAYYITYHLKFSDQMMGQTMVAMMTTGVGSTIGNFFGGIISDTFGLTGMFTFCVILTVSGAAILFVTCFSQRKTLFVNDRFSNL